MGSIFAVIAGGILQTILKSIKNTKVLVISPPKPNCCNGYVKVIKEIDSLKRDAHENQTRLSMCDIHLKSLISEMAQRV